MTLEPGMGAALACGKKLPDCLSNHFKGTHPAFQDSPPSSIPGHTWGLSDKALRASPCLGVILGCGRAAQSWALQAPNDSVIPGKGRGSPAISGQIFPEAKQVNTQEPWWPVVSTNLAWPPANAP